MNTRTVVYLVVIFLIINIGLFLVSQRNILNNKFQGSPTVTTSVPVSNQNVNLPVSLNNKAIVSALIDYNFQGTVTEKKIIDSNTAEIKLDSTGLPDFLITKTVGVFDSELKPSTIDKISVGTKVNVTASYDIRQKTWQIRAIFINAQILPGPK